MVYFEKSIDYPVSGPLKVWEEPLKKHRYVIGADVAEGLEHGDYSSAHVINAGTGNVAAHWHGHMDSDLYGEQLGLMGRWYNYALIGVEINGPGHVPVAALRRMNYPRLFRRRTIGNIAEKQVDQFGFLTNRISKPKIIEALNSALRDDTIVIHDAETLAELRSYIREYTTGGGVKMHGSPHDDRVMSLAIAWEMVSHQTDYPEVDPELEEGTFNYALERALEFNRPNEKEMRIGVFNQRNQRKF
jgi:hypothetical protein